MRGSGIINATATSSSIDIERTPEYIEHQQKYLHSRRSDGVDVTAAKNTHEHCHMSFMHGINTDECEEVAPLKDERIQNARYDIELTKLAEEHVHKKDDMLIRRRLELQRTDRSFWAHHTAPNVSKADLEKRAKIRTMQLRREAAAAGSADKVPQVSERMQYKEFLAKLRRPSKKL